MTPSEIIVKQAAKIIELEQALAVSVAMGGEHIRERDVARKCIEDIRKSTDTGYAHNDESLANVIGEKLKERANS